MYKPAILWGSFFAGISVVIGAFGAHYLKTILSPELLSSFETGVRYQMYHALGMILTGMITSQIPIAARRINLLFGIGIVCFSFSIYLLTFMKSTQDIGLGKLGLITPIGGVMLILGWAHLIVDVMKSVQYEKK